MKKENICFYRGFGAGIIITVMIMFLSMNYFDKNEITDIKDNKNVQHKEEIQKEEALKDSIIKQVEDKEGQNQKQVNKEIKEEIKKEIIKELKDEVEATAAEALKVVEAAKETEKEVEEVIINIEYGMDSYDVANLLMDKGLISDVNDFNIYMQIEGKAKRVQVGAFKIKVNSTYEEILDKIVS